MPHSFCVESGCKSFAVPKSSRCVKHRTEHQHVVRRAEDITFYNGNGWKKLRAMCLRINPVCQQIECTQAAYDVDHIIPIVAGGAKLKLANLQSLCHSCHSKKTQAERKRQA